MSRLGSADMGVATLNDMKANAEMIANLDPSVPLIADADTGYGGPIMVGRTVAQYIRAGVAGLHLEDQIANKRCGHLKGKQLVDIVEYASRIKAAALAREKHGDIVIIARTDALQGFGYDEAIKRLRAALLKVPMSVSWKASLHARTPSALVRNLHRRRACSTTSQAACRQTLALRSAKRLDTRSPSSLVWLSRWYILPSGRPCSSSRPSAT